MTRGEWRDLDREARRVAVRIATRAFRALGHAHEPRWAKGAGRFECTHCRRPLLVIQLSAAMYPETSRARGGA